MRWYCRPYEWNHICRIKHSQPIFFCWLPFNLFPLNFPLFIFCLFFIFIPYQYLLIHRHTIDQAHRRLVIVLWKAIISFWEEMTDGRGGLGECGLWIYCFPSQFKINKDYHHLSVILFLIQPEIPSLDMYTNKLSTCFRVSHPYCACKCTDKKCTPCSSCNCSVPVVFTVYYRHKS